MSRRSAHEKSFGERTDGSLEGVVVTIDKRGDLGKKREAVSDREGGGAAQRGLTSSESDILKRVEGGLGELEAGRV